MAAATRPNPAANNRNILAFYESRGALIGNIIHDAHIDYGVRLTYHQVAGALKRLLKRGLVQRLERGRYILALPSNTLTLASRIMVENVRLSSPRRKEPLERRSEDHYTLYDIAVEASRERANNVDTLELYMPITIHQDLLKKLLSSDGKRIVRVYYNSEQNIVKMELQVYKAKSRLGITTLHEWTSSYIIDLFVAAVLIILTLVTKRVSGGLSRTASSTPASLGSSSTPLGRCVLLLVRGPYRAFALKGGFRAWVLGVRGPELGALTLMSGLVFLARIPVTRRLPYQGGPGRTGSS